MIRGTVPVDDCLLPPLSALLIELSDESSKKSTNDVLVGIALIESPIDFAVVV
jgi:hypothetical protein